MKLRNKKTGEIGEVGYLGDSDGKILVNNINDLDTIYEYDSLAEFNAEWEDYEEPKDWWYIDIYEPHNVIKNDEFYQVVKEACKEIGNYFSSREEAEKAVEKLKAWKRLMDKGFRFRNWYWDKNGMHGFINFSIKSANIDEKDIDLLFGGEE